MRYLPLDFVKPHHVLAQPIYDKNFVEQLFDDGKLTTTRIEAIKRLGYYSVYVREQGKPDISNSISHETLNLLYTQTSNVFNLLKTFTEKAKPDEKFTFSIDQVRKLNEAFERLENIGENLVLELLRDQSPIVHLYETKSLKIYHVQHAVHTAVYAIKIGLKRNLNMKALRNLFMGAILNDIGYLLIKDFDPIKVGRIANDQKSNLNQHVRNTYDLLTQCDSISNVTRTICIQHHEKEDGTGYPSALKAEWINPLSKVLSASIAFDALISDRPFRPAYPIHKALEIMSSQVGSAYDSSVVDQLSASIAIFPLGTYITYNKMVGCVSAYDPIRFKPLITFDDGQTINFESLKEFAIGLKYTL